MGKWTYGSTVDNDIKKDGKWWATALSKSEAIKIIGQLDTYEARIAELEAQLINMQQQAAQHYRAYLDTRHQYESIKRNEIKLTAERDELADKEQCSHELFEAACNDLGDAQEEIEAATKTLSLALKHLHRDDYTLDGAETISTLATIAMHAMAGEQTDDE